MTNEGSRELGPGVSLLVPVFNRSDLLASCLNSVLAQTTDDWEVVVVDGGSTDDTWGVCQRYAEMDPRIRAFRDQVNTGPVRGWWRCLDEARGTLATFLWSDDLLLPTFLERTVPFLADDDLAFVFTAAEVGPQPGMGRISYAEPEQEIASTDFIVASITEPGRYPASPACALFRLEDIRRSFVFELPTGEGFDLTDTGAGTDRLIYLLTALRYPRIANIGEPLAFFRAHAGSISVDGRGGRVSLGYAMAESWFALAIGRPDLAQVRLARHWLSQMRAVRRIIRPAVAVATYENLISSRELVRAAASLIVDKMVRAGSRLGPLRRSRRAGN